MTKFRYTDAEEECDDAREILIKKQINLTTSSSIHGPKINPQRCAEDIMLINAVLDYVKHQFYINWEDK